jgi:hypothetical protein
MKEFGNIISFIDFEAFLLKLQKKIEVSDRIDGIWVEA